MSFIKNIFIIIWLGRESLKDVSGYLPSERYSPVRRTSEPVVTSSEHLEQPNIRNIQQEHIQLQVNLIDLYYKFIVI